MGWRMQFTQEWTEKCWQVPLRVDIGRGITYHFEWKLWEALQIRLWVVPFKGIVHHTWSGHFERHCNNHFEWKFCNITVSFGTLRGTICHFEWKIGSKFEKLFIYDFEWKFWKALFLFHFDWKIWKALCITWRILMETFWGAQFFFSAVEEKLFVILNGNFHKETIYFTWSRDIGAAISYTPVKYYSFFCFGETIWLQMQTLNKQKEHQNKYEDFRAKKRKDMRKTEWHHDRNSGK